MRKNQFSSIRKEKSTNQKKKMKEKKIEEKKHIIKFFGICRKEVMCMRGMFHELRHP